jgi:alkylation response protein AidB-like acyl-CoA dehydrogenase
VQLTFDADVEDFRAEFVAFLDEHLPVQADAAQERSRSTSHVPEWARQWQRLQFDHGWLLPGNPPEFGGRNAGVLQQYVHREELSRRRIYHCFNPQGVGIIAASLLTFGTVEQKQRWAVPILRAERTAALGMSEPGAGSDLAGLRTHAVLEDGHFVVNGQKLWTSGAHDADVILTFVRTDSDEKYGGISALLVPTDTPGVACRPFPVVYDSRHFDFNEVFFTDVRVPAGHLVGPLGGGWTVANGSLRHDRDGLPGAATAGLGGTRPRRSTRAVQICSPPAGLPDISGRMPAPSQAERRRFSATSSPSARSGCPDADAVVAS